VQLAVVVVQHWFILPSFGLIELNHADSMVGTIESVQNLLLHLSPAINGFWL